MLCSVPSNSTSPMARYGKKQLESMSADLASQDYLKDRAKLCPHCNAPIEKNEGCNKVWRAAATPPPTILQLCNHWSPEYLSPGHVTTCHLSPVTCHLTM